MFKRCMAGVMIAALAGCSGQEAADDTGAAEEPAGQVAQLTVPAGYPLLVALEGEVSTERNEAGDVFTVALVEPVIAGEREVVAAGARVRGRIDYLNPPEGDGPATMSLSLVEVDGRPVQTGLLKLEAEGSTGEDLEKVAAGGVVGGVIGAVLGGGKGAAVGAGVGAGAGAVVAIATGDDHIRLKEGQKMRFVLAEPYSVPLDSA